MKRSLLLLALTSCGTVLAADDNARWEYEFHGSSVIPTTVPSCGAASRLLHDRYTLRIRGTSATVNYTPWKMTGEVPGQIQLFHGAEGDAFTVMTMDLGAHLCCVNGVVTLTGQLPDRTPCLDMVQVTGRRI